MKVIGVDQGALANLENRSAPVVASAKQGNPDKITANKKNDSKDSQDVKYSPEQLKKSIDTLNETMSTYNTELHFELHEKSGEYMVKVLNTNDGSVIREIPPKKVLDMVAHFRELLGLMVDKMI